MKKRFCVIYFFKWRGGIQNYLLSKFNLIKSPRSIIFLSSSFCFYDIDTRFVHKKYSSSCLPCDSVVAVSVRKLFKMQIPEFLQCMSRKITHSFFIDCAIQNQYSYLTMNCDVHLPLLHIIPSVSPFKI